MTAKQTEELFKFVGKVDSRLDSGDKNFEEINEALKDLKTYGEALTIHLERHRTVRWVIGVTGGIATLVLGIARYFKN
jgi:hypothetical protein